MVEEFLEALDLSISKRNIRLKAFIQHSVCQNFEIDDLADNLQDRLSGRLDGLEAVHPSIIDIRRPGFLRLSQ